MSSWPFALAVPALLFCVTACGAGNSATGDAGTPDAGPENLYWSFIDQTCLHLDDGSGQNAYTISIAKDTVTVAGVTTYQFLLSNSVSELSNDWFGCLDDNLVLYRQYVPGNGTTTQDTYIVYNPPVTWLVKGLTPLQMPPTTTTMATYSGGTSQTLSETWTVNVEGATPVNADGMQNVMATPYLITESDTTNPMTTTKVWFAPMLGIVELSQPSPQPDITVTSIQQNVSPMNCSP